MYDTIPGVCVLTRYLVHRMMNTRAVTIELRFFTRKLASFTAVWYVNFLLRACDRLPGKAIFES